uniref:Ig-like domain-containing protein n=1 Tax=Cyprinus carpio TaxID=7962 RepID=A0A8C1ZTC7_CYPCA
LKHSIHYGCSTSIGDEIRLDQSPAEIKRPGETVKISCKISVSSYWMHWIRQKPAKALEWIGRIDSVFTLQGQFSITKDQDFKYQQKHAVFRGEKTEDTAVYYCAGDSE